MPTFIPMKFKPIWILHAVVAVVITTLFILQQIEYKAVYEESTALAASGDYDAAYVKMSKIEQYHDASDKITEYDLEIDYREGNKLISEEDWENALPIFENILSREDYKDSEYLKNQCIVESRRDGKIIKYSLQNQFINDLMNYAIESLKQNKF